MWEDYEKKHRVQQVLLLLVCVILAGALGAGMLYVRRQAAEEVATNVAAFQENSAAQNAAREELLAQVEADYQKDLDTVAQYLPGIVCWGDSITKGSVGGISYASTLQDRINETLVNRYNFKASLDYANSVTRVDWTNYTIKIPVVNMGAGDESTGTILGRSGAAPYVLSRELEIPADSTPVQVEFTAPNGTAVRPLTAGDGGINEVSIGGVKGTLTLSTELFSQGVYEYRFTRSEAGSAVTVPKGTEIVTGCADLYKDYVAVIFIGTYGGFESKEELISQIRKMVERQNTDRYLVIGPYYYTDSASEYFPHGGETYQFEKYENAMQQAFGDHFVNIRKYLISDAAADAKITLTAADKTQIKDGRVPDSLRASTNSIELSAKAYSLIGDVLYERMEALGYFDEVAEELHIDLNAPVSGK